MANISDAFFSRWAINSCVARCLHIEHQELLQCHLVLGLGYALCLLAVVFCFFIFENMFFLGKLEKNQLKLKQRIPPKKIISTQRAPGSILCSELKSGVSRCSNFTRGKKRLQKIHVSDAKKGSHRIHGDWHYLLTGCLIVVMLNVGK